MQLRVIALALALVATAHAATSIITGNIKDSQGNPINGSLVMRLPMPAQDPTTQSAVAPIPVTFQVVNGAVQGGAPLYDLATLQPRKLWYSARAYDASGKLVFYGNYFVTGPVFNIGAATPTTVTTSNISFANVGSSSTVATFSGVSDAKFDTTCSTTNNSNQLVCTDAPFTPCPTGARISVTGGAVDGSSNVISLITTVLNCTGATVANLSANATRTANPSPGARWGTDNMPSLRSQYVSAVAAGSNAFLIPPGNYLMYTPPNDALALSSGTDMTFQKGTNIFWVGPLGEPNNVLGGEGNIQFLFINDNTQNVHIRIDGSLSGDNVGGGPGSPSGNQSQLISIFNGFTGPINNINIDGAGVIQNIYGFDVRSIAPGNVNFTGLRVNVSGKGTNINSPGRQEGLYLFKSFGIETASSGAVITNNTFDASNLISLGGASGVCQGDIVANNSFLNTCRSTNLFIGDCVFGATITGNAFYVAGSGSAGVSISASTFGGEGSNIIANNTFTCGGAFPNNGQAAIASGTSIAPTAGNFFYNNTVNSDFGVANSYCNYGVLEQNSTSLDTFIGGLYTDSTHGLADFSVQGASGTSVLAIGVQTTSAPQVTAPATIDPRSSFVTPSGTLYGSGLGTGYVPGIASLTTTAATSDNVAITGVTSGTNCQLAPTNASAATNIATTYVSAKTTNQITVTHVATSGMTYDIQCSIK